MGKCRRALSLLKHRAKYIGKSQQQQASTSYYQLLCVSIHQLEIDTDPTLPCQCLLCWLGLDMD